MDHMYMCLVVNIDHHEIDSLPVFFKNIYEARIYAYQHAKRRTFNYLYHQSSITLGVCIFKIPFGVEVCCNDISMDSDIWEYFVRTILDYETKAAKVIQRKYRLRYLKKIDAAIFIQEYYRRAIGDPYTQLCKNRLMREFNEMSK